MQVLKNYKITCALIFGFLLYGISSFIYIKVLEIGHSQYQLVLNEFLLFQLVTIFLSFFYEKYISRKSFEDKLIQKIRIPSIVIFSVFIICFVIFYFFPWTEDRESRMAQFAGFLRLLWFVMLLDLMDGTKKDYKFLLLNVILMFIDSSRSTFAAIFLIHFFRRQNFNFFLILIGSILIFFVASVRSGVLGESSILESLFLFGFIGEGINGSIGSLQVLKIDTSALETFYIAFLSFFQPLLVLPKYILFFDFAKYFDVSHFYTVLVDQQLGESYYPTGGFYLVSQFVRLSYFGSLLMLLYIIFTLKFIKIIFKNGDFAFFFTLLILMIKMSPFTFWKWVIYLYFIHIIILFLKKIKI